MSTSRPGRNMPEQTPTDCARTLEATGLFVKMLCDAVHFSESDKIHIQHTKPTMVQ